MGLRDKGYIQLAMRSAAYERLVVVAVKEGEFESWNPLTEELRATWIEDQDKRDETQTVGYYAAFRLLNGFTKALYWTRSKMERHALRYSKGYAAKKGYTFWEKDFDGMAYKTMLRQLLGHWGLMTVELQTALSGDAEDAEAVEVHTVNAVELPMQVEALPADTGATEAPKIAVEQRKTEPVQVVTREREKPSVSAQTREKAAPKMISLDDL